MLSSFLTLMLHCILIIGKEGDRDWEEEVIMKKEESKEQKNIKNFQKRQRKNQENIAIQMLIEFYR